MKSKYEFMPIKSATKIPTNNDAIKRGRGRPRKPVDPNPPPPRPRGRPRGSGKPQPAPAIGLSLRQISDELALSREIIQQRLVAAGIDPMSPTLRWRDVVKSMQLTDWRAERARLTKAQADREEHDLAIAKGEVMTRADVAQWLQKRFGPVREWTLAMPSKMASRCNPTDPRHAQGALNEWAEEFLRHVRAREVDQENEATPS